MQPNDSTPPNPPAAVDADAQRMMRRFQDRFTELRRSLEGIPPEQVARRTGSEYAAEDGGRGSFRLPLWGRPMQLSYPKYEVYRSGDPSGEALPASALETAFLLYYFATADGTPLEERWIAFSDLADGRFYTQAFEGYTGKELARSFGEDLGAFEHAAARLKGRRIALGDAAFSFAALPRFAIAAVFWRGDEDFPSTCRLLFDASANHYLPTDACAVLGSGLTRLLIKARG